jgi:hypothetical protein
MIDVGRTFGSKEKADQERLDGSVYKLTGSE